MGVYHLPQSVIGKSQHWQHLQEARLFRRCLRHAALIRVGGSHFLSLLWPEMCHVSWSIRVFPFCASVT
ncbi:hypothetical protein MUK42_09830 [Musa troglodytarum]|uniref:Uncharacterized protein n=1 Tax=Musa troglodytarum TaxID=320322 RepID=A0A9E7EF57_9LILI|nr:hypothetical protein MUK42_09830 [Musa troglodytarum]